MYQNGRTVNFTIFLLMLISICKTYDNDHLNRLLQIIY